MITAKIDKNSAAFNLSDNILNEVSNLMEEEIVTTTEAISNEAQSILVSSGTVDFGFLKGSIAAYSNGLEGGVKVGENYAPYVEFGTGGMVDVPSGLEDYAIKFKGKGIKQVNLPARPFLFPAFNNQINLLNIRLDAALKKLNLK